MKFKNVYWSNLTKIELLERWVLVHSCIYYEMNSSIIEDKKFDINARQLAKMLRDYPEDAKRSRYYKPFKDFTGETGFHLYSRLDEQTKQRVMSDADNLVYRLYRKQ